MLIANADFLGLTLSLCFYVCVSGDHTGDVQDLFLTLRSAVTPDRNLGTMFGAEDRTWVSHVQGKCPFHCTIALAPIFVLFWVTLIVKALTELFYSVQRYILIKVGKISLFSELFRHSSLGTCLASGSCQEKAWSSFSFCSQIFFLQNFSSFKISFLPSPFALKILSSIGVESWML